MEDLEHCLEKVRHLSAKLEKRRAQVFMLIAIALLVTYNRNSRKLQRYNRPG